MTDPMPPATRYRDFARNYTAAAGATHMPPRAYTPPVDVSGLSAPTYGPAPHALIAPAADLATPFPPAYRPSSSTSGGTARAPRGLARWALALSIIGALLLFVPFLSGLGGVLVIVGVLLAVIALLRPRGGGKGLAAAATALAVIAWAGWAIAGAIADTSADRGVDDWSAVDDPAPDPLPASPDAALPVVASAFGEASYGGATWFAAVFDTPSSHIGAGYLDLRILALDARGDVLEEVTESIGSPTGTLAVEATFFDTDSSLVDRVVLEAQPAAGQPSAAIDAVLAIDVERGESDRYTTTTHVTVRSTDAREYSFVLLTVIARGPDGTIRGGSGVWADDVPADGTPVTVDTTIYADLPADTVFEVYVSR